MRIDTFHTTLEINGFEVAAKIQYTYHKVKYGAWADGLKVEPNEPAQIEVYDVYILMDDGIFYETVLPDIIIDDLANKIMEEI